MGQGKNFSFPGGAGTKREEEREGKDWGRMGSKTLRSVQKGKRLGLLEVQRCVRGQSKGMRHQAIIF